ncbi:MAG: TIGR02757 family protein [Bacteroidales bacterium]|nr:TIGR02757 family protein [Bacteroidales bacterium]
MINDTLCQELKRYAAEYEAEAFLQGDPSWFMHQVEGLANQEATAFVASCLSYGSRKQFMPKIQWLLDCAGGEMDAWVREGGFEAVLPAEGCGCFYRLNTVGQMNAFLRAYRRLLLEHGTLGAYVKERADSGLAAVETICGYFSGEGAGGLVPQDARSACKRVCMFLRWMVRSGSPVDLGLWADAIDRRTLIMPLDTHVLAESRRLGLLQCGSATMSAARRLTQKLSEVFPDDPLKGDFALFGYGVWREGVEVC